MYVWTAELAANALRISLREERLLIEKRLKRDQKSNVVLLSQGSHPEEIFGRRPLNRMAAAAPQDPVELLAALGFEYRPEAGAAPAGAPRPLGDLIPPLYPPTRLHRLADGRPLCFFQL